MKNEKLKTLTTISLITALLVLSIVVLKYVPKQKQISYPEVINSELINIITQNNDFKCNSISDMNMNDDDKNWYYNQCKIIKGEYDV